MITTAEMAEKMRESTLLKAVSRTYFGRFGWSYNVLQYGNSGRFPAHVSHTLGFHFLTKPRSDGA